MNTTYTIERDIEPIMRGDIPLPNPEPIKGDVGAAVLYHRQMHCGTPTLDGKKLWNARIFLDYGQGGGLQGSGIAAWTEWKDGAYRAVGVTFAICRHTKVDGPGANHSRGWHPGKCSKCGLDMTVDSGD